ncbi:MAG: glycosyltransferase [Streptosporangiaceae bacterium]
MSRSDNSGRWSGARIVILTDFLSDLAGTERYTVTVAMALAVRGAAVDVFVAEPPRNRTWTDLLTAEGVAVHAPGSVTAVASLWSHLNHQLVHERPDLVLVNPMGEALVGWLPTVPPNVPLPPIIGVEYSRPGPAAAHWYPPTLPGLIHHLDAVIATCEASRQGVIAHFGRAHWRTVSGTSSNTRRTTPTSSGRSRPASSPGTPPRRRCPCC